MTTILIKRSFAAGVEPSSLAPGELAVNVADRKVWIGDAASTPILINDKSEFADYLPLAGGTMTGAIVGPVDADTIRWEEGPLNASVSSDGTKVVLSVNDGDATFTVQVDKIIASRPIELPVHALEDNHAARVDYVNQRIAALGVPTPQVDKLGGVFAAEAEPGFAQYGISTSGAPIFKDIAVPPAKSTKLGGVYANVPTLNPENEFVRGVQEDGQLVFGHVVFPPATSYTLPTASATVLGGVKVGAGLDVAADGTLSSSASYTLPAASATRLGGVKIGSGITVTADGTISTAMSTNYVNKAGDVMNGQLRFAVASNQNGQNGVDAYLYMDAAYFRLLMPTGKQAWIADVSTGLVQFLSGILVNVAATFNTTITMSSLVSAFQFGTTGYNVFGGTGGVAVRSNNTNLQIITGASITNYVPMVTTGTGAGVTFGAGGSSLSRGSAATKIAASGMLELPSTAPAAGEAVRRDYVDARTNIVTAAGAAAPATTGLANGTLWIEV